MAAKPDENKASLVSLADAYPNLAAEWHPTLNGELTVDQVSPGSSRKVWWRCAAGHEWQANVKNSRRNERSSCPVCLGRRVVPGFNDLATVRPDLAAQWHPTQNGALTPAMVPRSTDRKVWWQCQKGHEWQATVNNRESKNQGCPFCGGSKAIPGVSDLATVEPAIAAQWHPTRNGELSPSMVLGGSSRVVWWLCDVAPDHEWRTAIANRTNSSNRTGCPMCVGHKVVASNCLAAKFPDVAAEWHPSRNGSLSPHLVTTRVTRKVWWQCSKGHEWRTAISSRTRPKPTGCPYCSRKKAIPGETDFATLHPEIAAELHPTRNGAITPNMLRPGSNKKVWWRCVKGHEWQVYVAQRTIHSSGCPYCAGQRPIVGVNDLATTHPDIAAQWNRTRNKHLTPESVMAGTDRKVWWICDDGHEWAAPPYSRTNGIGCPSCAKTGFNPTKDGWLYLLEHDQWSMQQIGITNSPEARLTTHRRGGWAVLDLRGPMPGDLAKSLERAALAALKRRGARLGGRASRRKFDGHTESWSEATLKVIDLSTIVEWVRDDEWSRNAHTGRQPGSLP